MQTALQLVNQEDDGLFLPVKAGKNHFKIEMEDSLFAIYEACKTGGLQISRGYDGPFLHCILVGWDVVAEGCADVPTYEEFVKKPMLAVAA